MKIRTTDLSDRERMTTLDALYTATSSLKGRLATKQFLRDLLTPSERIMLGRRIIIARLLLQGEAQEKIAMRLKTSVATIYRVRKWLRDQMPGYEEAIRGMEYEYAKRQDKRMYAKSSLYRLKKKYPLHFLLFPTPKEKSDTK